jgi:hypothetical protein
MYFTFTKFPQSQPVDLTKCFDGLQVNPQTAQKIGEINQRRVNFYSSIGKLGGSPLTQDQQWFDWMPLLQYLNDGPDLLLHVVKEANYPAVMSFSSPANQQPVQECRGNFLPYVFR